MPKTAYENQVEFDDLIRKARFHKTPFVEVNDEIFDQMCGPEQKAFWYHNVRVIREGKSDEVLSSDTKVLL